MNSPGQIHYLKRQELDTVKWNDCIDGASNGMVYAYSFYLDRMARNWDALVWNDYEAVMPLTWNKKWGIRYLYQPPMTQQLGIFFRDKATALLSEQGLGEPQNGNDFPEDLIEIFLAGAAQHFRFAEIFLNYKNQLGSTATFSQRLPAVPSPFPPTLPRMNYVLPLGASYFSLREQYSPELLRNLVAAATHALYYTDKFDPADAIDTYYRLYRKRIAHVKRKEYDHFLEVCRYLEKEGGVITRAVYESPTRQQLLAVSVLLKKNNRLYLILPAVLPEGKINYANHFLLDQLIREFAGQELLLDFEGSDIPGIARFYKKFTPQEQPFFFWKFNRLPGMLKLFKK